MNCDNALILRRRVLHFSQTAASAGIPACFHSRLSLQQNRNRCWQGVLSNESFLVQRPNIWSFFILYFIWNTSCSQDNTRKSYNDLFPVWSIDDVWGFRVGGGVHDSYTFQCGLVGYFTSPDIDTR